jgi:GTP-binding protein HflX
VADASSPSVDDQVAAVRRVLGEIGAGSLPEVLALNKADLLDRAARPALARGFPDAVIISAATGEGIDELLEALARALPRPPVEVTLLIPFGREDVTAHLYRDAQVLEVEPDSTGTVVRARVGERELASVAEFLLRPVRRRVSTT